MKKNIVLLIVFNLCSFAIFSNGIKNIYWKNVSENEGSEAVVIVETTGDEKDQNLTIEIYPEGKNELNCTPYAFFKVPVVDGKASAVWKFQRGSLDVASKNNPKFIAIAHYGSQSAQTKLPLEVKLNRVSVKKLKWLDENDKTIKKSVMGNTMICSADVEGIVDKVIVKISNVNTGKIMSVVEVPVVDNKVYLCCVYQWDGIYLEKKPSWVFEIEAPGCEPVKSGTVEISMSFKKRITYMDGEPFDDLSYKVTLMNGKIIKGKTDKDGMIIIEGLIPGEVYLDLGDYE